MGVLDDAIRDHFDLRRRHGASAEEIAEQEREVLGPVRRDAAAEEARALEAASEAEAAESLAGVDDEVVPEYPGGERPYDPADLEDDTIEPADEGDELEPAPEYEAQTGPTPLVARSLEEGTPPSEVEPSAFDFEDVEAPGSRQDPPDAESLAARPRGAERLGDPPDPETGDAPSSGPASEGADAPPPRLDSVGPEASPEGSAPAGAGTPPPTRDPADTDTSPARPDSGDAEEPPKGSSRLDETSSARASGPAMEPPAVDEGPEDVRPAGGQAIGWDHDSDEPGPRRHWEHSADEDTEDHPRADARPGDRGLHVAPAAGEEAAPAPADDPGRLVRASDRLGLTGGPGGTRGEDAASPPSHGPGGSRHPEDRPPASETREGERPDMLEETPDFLQETPEHDRLWFEQKPPRDFDFDD